MANRRCLCPPIIPVPNYRLQLLLLMLQLLSFSSSTNSVTEIAEPTTITTTPVDPIPNRGRNYIHNPSNEDDHLHRPCHKTCRQGGCRYQNCGKNNNNDDDGDGDDNNMFSPNDSVGASCDGGLCEFVDCVNPSCDGGACTFVRCQNATCRGGGCHFVHPLDTLKDGYCGGGGCRLNGEVMPSNLRYYLSRWCFCFWYIVFIFFCRFDESLLFQYFFVKNESKVCELLRNFILFDV